MQRRVACQLALATLLSLDLPTSLAATDMAPIILDNMDINRQGEVHNMFEGSYQPCLADAHQGQYHHDWARNKGNAHITLTFDPPESGCYDIEEYHPGGIEQCSSYLPRNARLDVDYCMGLSKTFTINQAEKPAQWNKIGSLIFFTGHEGRFTMRSSGGEKCAAADCFLVADAFRLTKTGEVCASAAPPRQDQDATPDQGSLLLDVAGGQDEGMDVRLQLLDHSGAIEAAIQAHFAYDRVEVTGVSLVNGRRLQGRQLAGCGGRRLQDRQLVSAPNFEVEFQAYGGMGFAPGSTEALRDILNANLANVGASLEVKAATVAWSSSPGTTSKSCALLLIVGSSALVLGALVAGIICLTLRRARKMPTGAEASEPKVAMSGDPMHVLEDPEKGQPTSDGKGLEKEGDAEVRSVSTEDPTDQQGGVIDSASSEGGTNSADSEAATSQQPAEISKVSV